MKPETFARLLKIVIVGTTLIGAACCIYVLPTIMDIIRNSYPEYEHWIMPWSILIYICAVPCFIAMFICWKIAVNIQADNSFSMDNAGLFKVFSYLALGDSVVFLFGSILLFLFGMNHPGLLIIDILIVFAGFAIFVCTSALSYLVAKAANLQEDSNLTI